jgi:hypothetical protein
MGKLRNITDVFSDMPSIVCIYDYIHDSKLVRFIAMAYYFAIETPLESAYLKGYWVGQKTEDICSVLTRSPADFWANHAQECNDLILRNFNSWMVLVYTMFYGVFLLFVFKSLLNCVGSISTCFLTSMRDILIVACKMTTSPIRKMSFRAQDEESKKTV